MPPEPHGAAAAGRQRGESADGRARWAWVDRDGSRSATLGEQLTVKNGEGLRIWPPAGGPRRAQHATSPPKTPNRRWWTGQCVGVSEMLDYARVGRTVRL